MTATGAGSVVKHGSIGRRLLASVAFAALALAAVTSAGSASAAADKSQLGVDAVELGTKDDCVKRLGEGGKDYCGDLFTMLGEVEAFWKSEFDRIVKPMRPAKGLKYTAPTGLYRYPAPGKTCGAYCATPGFYQMTAKAVLVNEPLMREFHEKGDFSALIVIAHEWGHHIQKLMERSGANILDTYGGEGRLTIHNELQADCFAGMFTAWEEKSRKNLEPGDVDEAMRILLAGGDDLDWKHKRAHGAPEQRVSAFRGGYLSKDAQTCADWFQYKGQPLLSFGSFNLAVPVRVAGWKLEISQKDTYHLTGMLLDATVRGVSVKAGQTASSRFDDVVKTMFASKPKLGDTVKLANTPYYGTTSQAEVDKATTHARRYERKVNGVEVHGILYLFVRSNGAAIVINVEEIGKASSAGWSQAEADLQSLILGIGLK